MISINNLTIEFSAKAIFNDISFVVNENDKIALTGKNGAGKSTLLKAIAGLQPPTRGNIVVPNGISVGYLPQQLQIADLTSVRAEVAKAFADRNSLLSRLDEINHFLATSEDYESRQYSKALEEFEIINHRLEMLGNSNPDAEIERTLLGLGFLRTDFDRPTAEFSGGWRMRIELAKILLQNPDVLLLDEPTNHLDIESIQWLEHYLINKSKALMLVSHDKAFIDNVTSRTIEISCGKIYDYKVNYTQFLSLRRERIEHQRRAWENQQKEISEIKDFIERFRYKPTKSNQVQSRIKMLERIIPIEIDEVDNSRLRLKFPPAPRSGDYPLIIDNVGKAYGLHQVFDHATLTIRRGEKVAFVGKNGQGKSTMLKCIMQEIPFTGEIKIGHNVSIGYFAQNQAQLLDGDITVFDTIDHVATGDIRTRIRDILGAFMFGGEAADKKVKVLSGGEKTRLAMIKLLLEPMNLLILDEPTNHLDIQSKEILKEAIRDFSGTVIVVSHDRDFLDGLVSKVYEFSDGSVRENLGGIYDFLNRRGLSSLKELESNRPVSNSETPKETELTEANGSSSSGKASYAEMKERERTLRRARKAVEEAEKQIEQYEIQISELEEKIALGDSSEQTLSEYASLQENLSRAMNEWEKAQNNLDELEK